MPVVPDLVDLQACEHAVISLGESILLSHPVSAHTCFKLVNRLDIKNGIRQPIPVLYGMYAEVMAPDALLGMVLEYLISMTSAGVGG